MTVRPIPPGTYLGRGCDSEIGVNYGEGINFEPAQPLLGQAGSGQRVEFHLQQITTTQELSESLNVSASASVGFGTFSASAEVKYASQQQINQYSTYLLTSVIVKNPDLIIRSPRLKPDIFQLLQEKGWEEFERSYGPEYMAGVISGGCYYGLIEIKTKNQQEQQDVVAAISASYGTFEASGDLDLKLKKAIENKELKVTVLQSGGSGDPLEVKLEDMVEQAKNFPQLIKDHPVEFQGIFEEYHRTVPLPPAIGEGGLSRAHRLNILEELGQKYWKYKDYRSNLIYVIDHFLDFEEHLDLSADERKSKLDRYQRDLENIGEQMNEIERRARHCRDSSSCELPGSYYAPIESLPTFNGENMLLKELEEQVNKLRQEMDGAQQEVSNLKLAINVDATKEVGIGTSNPKAPLHLYSANKPTTLRLQSSGGFGPGRIEFWSNPQGSVSEWRPGFIESIDNGSFTGGIAFHVNGTGSASKTSSQEVMRVVDGRIGIGTAEPKATLDVDGDISIKGNKPFQLKKYVGNAIDTGFSVKDWVATIAGFRALNGDIQENDSGDVMQIYTHEKNGNWWYFADFRSHNRSETWEVWVLLIRRELVS